MAFISDSIARMLFGARHEETTSKTVASAVSRPGIPIITHSQSVTQTQAFLSAVARKAE